MFSHNFLLMSWFLIFIWLYGAVCKLFYCVLFFVTNFFMFLLASATFLLEQEVIFCNFSLYLLCHYFVFHYVISLSQMVRFFLDLSHGCLLSRHFFAWFNGTMCKFLYFIGIWYFFSSLFLHVGLFVFFNLLKWTVQYFKLQTPHK